MRRPVIGLRAPHSILPVLLALPWLTGCTRETRHPPLFRMLTADRTGVAFVNSITTSDSINVQTDVFVYNGAGVAIGDVDDDGMPDLFFTGNMVSSRLYLNQGDMRFVDITESAGLATERWATGASMLDINDDGHLDIYVSISGPEWTSPDERANLLFVNNGDRTFTEAAAAYGLDDTGFTAHAVFLDYDRDGDLDAFLLGNAPEEFARGEAERHPAGIRSTSTGSYDQLYRNDGDGTFTNVSIEAGILREVGFGLGVGVSDLNGDGWPDIYVSNDDTPSDVLYVNNGDGTFTDRAAAWLKHTSFAGMGMDIADFNNDGWPDILQTDMMPAALSARKRMAGAMTYGGFMQLRRQGFHHGYSLNTLQLNSGVMQNGDIVFSEIARMAGVAYTAWSWSVLFGDYDNDGFKDVLVTNGYPKAVIDYDYQVAMHQVQRSRDQQRVRERGFELLEQLPSYEFSNHVFQNNGDLTFTDRTGSWGMERPGFSYGAALADLNGDGTLDVVVNNINEPAFIYENVGSEGEGNHYFRVALEGESPNRGGIGSTVIVHVGDQSQHVYHSPYRGYVSTMEPVVHFGLRDATRVDSLVVRWPNGRSQRLTDLAVDRVLTVRQVDATSADAPNLPTSASDRPFQSMGAEWGLSYEHEVQGFVDYSVQPLLPHMLSRQGPPLASGDVTGDGLDDLFIGGAAGSPGTLLIQQRDGSFAPSPHREPWVADRDHDDWGARFLDADGDGRLDLYVASGGYRFSPSSDLLQDRLYINQGDGRFVRDVDALPQMPTSTAGVAIGDFDGDGRSDVFVGGRVAPRDYPMPTRSYVLRNEGGIYRDVTEQVIPELAQPAGMITDALWIDFNGDRQLDLVTAGVWMPIQFYAGDGARFRNVTDATGLPPLRGWWYRLAAGDFNDDGHPDVVAGNLGLNHSYTTSEESRFGVYAADFTGNLTTDIVLTREVDGTEYPYYGLATLGRSIYTVSIKFPTYESFAEASIAQVFVRSQLQQAVHYQADTFASVYLQSNGDGTFTVAQLPNHAQIAPIRGIVPHDVDGDGRLDLIIAGNLYHTEPNTPRADAGNGLWLRGDGAGHFTPIPPARSGFLAPLDVADLALLETVKGIAVVVANNGDSLQAFLLSGR